jgi:hypothetical protein
VTSLSGTSRANQSQLPQPKSCEKLDYFSSTSSISLRCSVRVFVRPRCPAPRISRGVWPLHDLEIAVGSTIYRPARSASQTVTPSEAPFKNELSPHTVLRASLWPSGLSSRLGPKKLRAGPNTSAPMKSRCLRSLVVLTCGCCRW